MIMVTLKPGIVNGQTQRMISGKVIDKFSLEPIAFASVYWKSAGQGCVTDSTGGFKITGVADTSDVLTVSYVGYSTMMVSAAALSKDTGLIFPLETAIKGEVIITAKSNKGLRWWKNIVAHKLKAVPICAEKY